ncbi:hypothetical protein PYW07_016543 [Mythimna separata]|uniref:Uncharacterized protein n=1 Tax=Mythimna separata TaxID=271217 RepID=A0AAD7YKT2_MYTSE|nr:hypothetical protein PYW07_016543 [Mythimna separata]
MMPSSPDRSSIRSRQYKCFPIVDHCCGCVTELKTAAAIIAVLGVVTSPAVSWAFVRHSYVIRVSCFIATDTVRADVVDVHIKNVLSFGFGANSGLGPSCLGGFAGHADYGGINNTEIITTRSNTSSHAKRRRAVENNNKSFIQFVRWVGWLLLIADSIFIILSLHLLYSIFNPPARRAAMRFIISCIIAISLSFLHGMMYVGVCIAVGGNFPIFEFVFCIIDIIAWSYFVIVVNSYRRDLYLQE